MSDTLSSRSLTGGSASCELAWVEFDVAAALPGKIKHSHACCGLTVCGLEKQQKCVRAASARAPTNTGRVSWAYNKQRAAARPLLCTPPGAADQAASAVLRHI